MSQYYSALKNQFSLAQYMDIANLHSVDTSQFTLSGSQISSWNDGISAWTQGTAGNRPLLTSGVPIFDGSNDQLIRAAEISRTEFSMYMVFKDTGAVGKIFLSAQSASDYFIHNAPASLYDGIVLNVGGVTKLTLRAGITGNRYSIFSIRRTGNTFTARINDRILIQTTNTFAGQATLIARMMSFVSGGFAMAGGVKAFCMSSTNLSDTIDLQVRNNLYSIYNLAADNAAECVKGFGDSNTVGPGSVFSYLRTLSTSLGVADANIGISGSRCSALDATSGIARYQTQLISRPYTDYVVIQYGTNDILASISAATFATALSTIVTGLISAGYTASKICLCSCPYQRSSANATALDNYRTEILNIATTHGTKYFDLLQYMRDNGGDSLLVVADNVHLNQTAQNGWSAGVLTALTT